MNRLHLPRTKPIPLSPNRVALLEPESRGLSVTPVWKIVPASEPEPPPVSREQRIRERAYQCYLARAGGPGAELSDWLTAEREILAEEQRRNAGACS